MCLEPSENPSRHCLCPRRALDYVPAFLCLSFLFPLHTWFLSDQMAQAGFRQSFFTPIYMTDFVPICSLMAGEGMREPGEVISVEHRTVLPTAISAQPSLFSTQQVRSRETETWQQMSWDAIFPRISEVPLSSSCPGDVDITTSGHAAVLSMI